jgi:hypothetical protein
MTNRVLIGIAAAAASASLILGGGVVSASSQVGPAPAPPSGPLDSAQQSAAPDWTAVPLTPTTPASTTQDQGCSCVILPAPASHAAADVLEVNPLDICISCTSASAGHDETHAQAKAIRLLGIDVAGGESKTGHTSGALLAIPANPLLALALADWATESKDDSPWAARSRASLVDLVLGPHEHHEGHSDGAITLAVLEASSRASHDGFNSKGYGENNGVHLDAGDGALVLILLHSDASSSDKGSAYVVGINGTKLVSDEQTGQSGIPIQVPGVVGLILLKTGAEGGTGSAAVGTASDLLGQSGQAAGVLAATGNGLNGQQAAPLTGAPPATGAAAPATGLGLSAPSTGVALGVTGLVIVPAGLALLFASLRRRRAAG